MKTIFNFAMLGMAVLFMNFSLASDNMDKPVVDDFSITVKVKTPSGNPAKSVKVNYGVCESLSCMGMGKAQYTDSYGEATLTSRSGCKICFVYVDGKEYKDRYVDGDTYTFTRR